MCPVGRRGRRRGGHGPAADKRPAAGGETVHYYPRLPFGNATYAARIAPDGKLVALEQRLTLENVDELKPGVTRAADVLDLLGPPYRPIPPGGGALRDRRE